MKKKSYWILRTILLFCVFANGVSVFAQSKFSDIKTVWGPEEKGVYPNTSVKYDFIGKDDSGIYVAKKSTFATYENKHTELIHYSHDLRILNSQKVELNNNDRVHEFFIFLNQQLCHFYFARNGHEHKFLLHVEIFDRETLLPKGDDKVLGSVLVKFDARDWPTTDKFQYQLSNDRTKILVYSPFYTSKKENKKFRLFVLDNKLNLLWDKEVTLPYNAVLFNVQNYKIDNNGDVYVAGRHFFKKSEQEINNKEAPKYRNEVITFSKKGAEMKIIPIKLEDKLLGKGKLLINTDQDAVYAGFYRNNKSEQFLGTYYFKISGETKEVIMSKSQEFSFDLISYGLTKNEIEKINRKKANGKFIGEPISGVDSLVLREDGGVFIIGKRNFYPESSTFVTLVITNIRVTQDVLLEDASDATKYNYGAIIISFDKKGNFEWEKKIKQNQSTSEIGYIYFNHTMATINNSLYYIFNDHPRNINYTAKERMEVYKGRKESVVIGIKINPDGSGFDERKVLLSGGQNMENYKLIPASSKHLGSNKIMLFTKQKKFNKIVEISLD